MSEAKQRDELAGLEAMLTAEAPPEPGEAARVYAALQDSADAQERYDRLALALRVMEPGEARSAGERAFGEAAFLGGLDAMLAAERAGEQAPPVMAPVISLEAVRARRVAALCVALAACALAVWGVQRAGEPGEGEEFTARSARPASPGATVSEEAQVAVFCVKRDAAGVARFMGADEAPLGALACDVRGELQVAYVADAAAGARYAAFFGVDEQGALLWYGPSPAAPGPLGVEAGEALKPAGQTVRLSVNHRPGMVRVFGLFSEEPLELARVQRWVSEPRAWLTDEGAQAARRAGLIVAQTSFEVVEEGSP